MTIIGILRVIAFSHFFWDPSYDFANTWGPSYSAIEINLAITAACIPALRPLLRRWFPHLFRSASSSGQSGPYHQKQRYYGQEGRSANSKSIRLESIGQTRADVRSGARSPTDSQERIFGSNGIVKTTNVRHCASLNFFCFDTLTCYRSMSPTTTEQYQLEILLKAIESKDNVHHSRGWLFDREHLWYLTRPRCLIFLSVPLCCEPQTVLPRVTTILPTPPRLAKAMQSRTRFPVAYLPPVC